MSKWEYKVHQIEYDDDAKTVISMMMMGHNVPADKQVAVNAVVEATLNDFGKDGWEAIEVSNMAIVFKREVQTTQTRKRRTSNG